MSSRAAALLALALFGALPSPAAAEPAKVAIAPFAAATGDVPVGAGAKLSALLAAQLDGLDTVSPTALPAEADAAAERSLIAAREAVAEAQDLARHRQHSRAAAAYRRAIAAFEAAASALESSAELADAHAALAAELFLTADDAGGERELHSAVALAPKRAFAGEATSPLFAALVQRAREASARTERSRARFDSVPDRARVQLDGAEAGRTPLEVRDVPPGDHLFRILLPSSPPLGGVLHLDGARPARAEASLGGSAPQAQLAAALAKGTLDAPALALARQVAAGAGADYLVLGALVAQGSELWLQSFLFSASSGGAVRLPGQRFDLELLSAGTALFKVAAEVPARVSRFGDAEPLPAALFPSPAPAPAELSEVTYATLAAPEPREHPAPSRGPRRPIDPKKAGALRPREK